MAAHAAIITTIWKIERRACRGAFPYVKKIACFAGETFCAFISEAGFAVGMTFLTYFLVQVLIVILRTAVQAAR